MAFIQIQNNCHTIVVMNNHLWVLDEEILCPYYTIEVVLWSALYPLNNVIFKFVVKMQYSRLQVSCNSFIGHTMHYV